MYQPSLLPVSIPGISWTGDVAALLLVLAVLLLCALIGYVHGRERREHALRLRAERLVRFNDRLQELSGAASRARTPAAVIEACLPQFLYGAGACAGAIIVVSDDGQRGELAHAIGYDEALLSTWRQFPLADGHPLSGAIRRHDIISVDSPARLVEREHTAIGDAATVTTADQPTLVVPLLTTERPIGFLIVTFQDSAAADASRFLQAGARRTAEALVRAQGYEIAERARADAEDLRSRADQELRERQKVDEALRESETKYRALAARTSLLHELSAALSESVTLDAVAKAIVRHGKVVVGASAG